jgi:hypothetical protein
MADDGDLVDTIMVDIGEAANEGEFDDEIDAMMDEIVDIWRGNSPEDSGEYKESIRVVKTAEGGRGGVAATAEYSNIIEYGSERTPEFAPMRKTVEEMNRRAGAG